MAGRDGTLRIRVLGDTSDFARGMQGAGSDLSKFGGGLQSAGRNLTVLTAPIAAIGAGALKMGLDFDTSLRRIVGLTDVTTDEIDGIRDALLRLGPEVGKSPQELADAFYFIASAGFTSTEAMDVLTVSAKASAAGMGQAEDVARVLGSVINAYGKENLSAARAGDILTEAVSQGTAEASEFAGVLGRVAPTAAALGVEFSEVSASLSGMTLTGLSAEESATSLNQVLLSLLKPTQEAEGALAEMGTSSAELRSQLRDQGLLDTLRTLEERFAGNEQAASLVFGNVRALRGVTSLLTLDTDQLNSVFEKVDDSLGRLQTGYEETEGPQRELDRAMADMQATALELAEDILPLAVEVFKDIAQGARNVAEWWRTLDDGTQRLIIQLGAVAVAAGPVMFAFGSLTRLTGGLIGGLGDLTGAAAKGGKGLVTLAADLGGVQKGAIATKAGLLGVTAGLGTLALAGGAVAVGLLAINEGLNLSNQHAERAIDIWRDLSVEQRETAASTEVLGMRTDDIVGHFANITGMLVPWHELSGTTRELASEMDGTAEAARALEERAAAIERRMQGMADAKKRATDEAAALASQLRGDLSTALLALGADFTLTDADAEALAVRFGTTAAIVREEWGNVETSFADQSKRVREYLASLPVGFEQTAEEAQRMAAILGVSAEEVIVEFDHLSSAITASTDDIVKSLGNLSGSANDEWKAFKDAARDGTQDPEARMDKLARRIEKLNAVDLHSLGPAALSAWLAARTATETELEQLQFFVDNKGPIIANIVPAALRNSLGANRTAWSAIYGVGQTALSDLEDVATTSGHNIGSNLAAALDAERSAVRAAAHGLAVVVKNHIVMHSPAKEGPWSERGGPIEWMRENARRMVEAFTATLRGGDGDVAEAIRTLASGEWGGIPGLGGGRAGLAALGGAGAASLIGSQSQVFNINGAEPGAVQREVARAQRKLALEWSLNR